MAAGMPCRARIVLVVLLVCQGAVAKRQPAPDDSNWLLNPAVGADAPAADGSKRLLNQAVPPEAPHGADAPAADGSDEQLSDESDDPLIEGMKEPLCVNLEGENPAEVIELQVGVRELTDPDAAVDLLAAGIEDIWMKLNELDRFYCLDDQKLISYYKLLDNFGREPNEGEVDHDFNNYVKPNNCEGMTLQCGIIMLVGCASHMKAKGFHEIIHLLSGSNDPAFVARYPLFHLEAATEYYARKVMEKTGVEFDPNVYSRHLKVIDYLQGVVGEQVLFDAFWRQGSIRPIAEALATVWMARAAEGGELSKHLDHFSDNGSLKWSAKWLFEKAADLETATEFALHELEVLSWEDVPVGKHAEFWAECVGRPYDQELAT